ncbi:MAG: C40 family peptidase [Phycisphaerales bacterium]|nr:C40 family peptidase [Phycisphaerales bacterium]
MAIDFAQFAGGLIGKSYAEVGGCWGLVHAVLARAGIVVPPSIEGALAAADAIADVVPDDQAARAGDILVMSWPPAAKRSPHVALCLSAFEAVHAWREDETTSKGEVRRTPIGTLLRLGASCELRRVKAVVP